MSPTFTIVLGPHGQVADLKSGVVQLAGANLDFIDVPRMPSAYRRMARKQEFDICELAPTTYLMAREAGAPITALPIPMTRRFRHTGLQRRRASPITTPKQLEGRAVGVRAYSVTAPVWTRGILADEYGVDLSKVTWLTEDEEHVSSYVPPANVQAVAAGQTLAGMVRAGDLDVAFSGLAGVGGDGDLDLVEFFDNAAELERDWWSRTRIYPLHGVIAIRNDVLRQHPWLAAALYDAFVAAKSNYLARIDAGAAAEAEDRRYRKLAQVVGDPLPYGLEENFHTFEALIRYAHAQHLIKETPSVRSVFVDPRQRVELAEVV